MCALRAAWAEGCSVGDFAVLGTRACGEICLEARPVTAPVRQRLVAKYTSTVATLFSLAASPPGGQDGRGTGGRRWSDGRGASDGRLNDDGGAHYRLRAHGPAVGEPASPARIPQADWAGAAPGTGCGF